MISGICNHAGGPLGEPGFEEDHVPAYPVRVVGISSTVMNTTEPRYSGSEALLTRALAHASSGGCETRPIRLNDLKFRACGGYYSKSAHACT